KADHNHDSAYSAIGHNHSGTYAPTEHTHLYAGSASAGGPATTALACTGNSATATDAAFVGNQYHIPVLGGGQYSTQIGTVTGALIISLPKSWTNTLVRFTVSIFNCETNSSIDYFVGGYTYITSSRWLYCFAYCLSNKGSNLENLPVSFGYYNGKCAIQIGAVSTVWSYPQVIVHDLHCGYISCDYTTWKTGWAVSFSATEITAAGSVLSGIRPRASRAENADILTTPRALTIGSTAKNFDGSAAVSWTLAEIGAAPTAHNHDSTYLKLSGGTVTGKINLDTNGGIFKSGWEGNRIAYFVSGDLTTSADYTLSSFALSGHNHDGVYSLASHTHSGYAATTHNHDSDY
ncbi:MAG: hypothetical protein EOM51_12120, partial [Clostridia bacterium]|nr:hypothetical protein [Clostridia bacterium]